MTYELKKEYDDLDLEVASTGDALESIHLRQHKSENKTVMQSFGVVLGTLEITEELENAVYNCCPDGLLSSSGGIVRLDIDREAPTMAMAMISAIDRLRKAGVPIVSIEMGGIPSGARISGPLVHQHELQTNHPS